MSMHQTLTAPYNHKLAFIQKKKRVQQRVERVERERVERERVERERVERERIERERIERERVEKEKKNEELEKEETHVKSPKTTKRRKKK